MGSDAEKWQRDAAGNVISTRDRDGRITERPIGSWNLVVERWDSLGHGAMSLFHDSADRCHSGSARQRLTIRLRPQGPVDSGPSERPHPRGVVFDVGDHFVEKRGGDGTVLFTNRIHDNHLVSLRQLATGGSTDTTTMPPDVLPWPRPPNTTFGSPTMLAVDASQTCGMGQAFATVSPMVV